MTTMNCKKSHTTNRNTRSEILTDSIRQFLSIQHAYLECSDEIQSVIKDMIEVFNSADSTEDERNGALYTIVEAIFPDLADEVCENCEHIRKSHEAQSHNDYLKNQERVFAENVRKIMNEKQITQVQLAESIGIGQSAISNLLGRQCRPQRKTVEKIARALDVPIDELWIDISAHG